MTLAETALKAERAHAAGRLDAAIALYLQAAAMAPDDPTFRKKLAGLYRESGDVAKRMDALLDAAEAHARRGEGLKAIATAKLALGVDPDHERGRRVLADLQRREERREESGTFRVPSGAHAVAVIPLLRKSNAKAPLPAITPLSSPPVKVDDLVLDEPKKRPIPLFSSLPEEVFRRVVAAAQLLDLPEGQDVFQKGDASDALYIVVEGSVSVHLDPAEPPTAVLSDGEFFGEIGVFTGKARSATVRTRTPVELMQIGFGLIGEIVRAHPSVMGVLLRFLRQRLSDNVLSRSSLFSVLGEADRRALRNRFSLIDVDDGAVLIAQGQPSPAVYVLIDGLLDVVHTGDGASRWIAQLTPGEVCGEISVMTQLPAVADVRAREKCIVLSLPATGFFELVSQHPALMAEATRIAGSRMEAISMARQKAGKPELIVLE
jgi:CRP-like cAMP-binding protein